MGAVREHINHSLLRVSYKDKKQLRKLLKMWGTLDELGNTGDTVAICILLDLKNVTGIDMDLWRGGNTKAFNECYKKGWLSLPQFIAVAYTLVLGYTQAEVAQMQGVDQSVISRNIDSGLKRMQTGLRAFEEED